MIGLFQSFATINSQDRSDVALLLADALRKRSTPTDIVEATDILKKLVDSPNKTIAGGREYVATVVLPSEEELRAELDREQRFLLGEAGQSGAKH